MARTGPPDCRSALQFRTKVNVGEPSEAALFRASRHLARGVYLYPCPHTPIWGGPGALLVALPAPNFKRSEAPAKAGVSQRPTETACHEIPAFAGMTGRVYFPLSSSSVRASAGRNASMASSASVMSIGVPNIVVVLRKDRSPWSLRRTSGTATPP